jgi:Tfp pilus assembly protein PilV
MKFATPRNRNRGGFTLAEVMAAMLFLAVVIPVAVEVMHLASLGGEVAVRKSMAMRVADRVLNESLVMTNWSNGTQSGTITEGALDFRWTLTSQSWPQDSAMRVITAEVKFTAQARDFAVQLNTLALEPGLNLTDTTQ